MGRTIQQMNTASRSDLGLLSTLVAIADTGSVSLAAAQMNLSQPSVSHALKRLRDLTGDQLFKRERGRLVQTARAEALVAEARQIVRAASRILSHDDFTPEVSNYTYRFASTDYGLLACLGPVRKQLLSTCPNAKLSISWVDDTVYESLRAQKVDFAFTGDVANPLFGRELVAHIIFQEKYIGVMCKDHPLAKVLKSKSISKKQWTSYDHMQFSSCSPSASTIDQLLLKVGLERRIAVSSPSHSFNLASLPGTHLLYALPSRLRPVVDTSLLVTFDLPIEIPSYPFYLAYHKATPQNPALGFALKLVLDLFEA